MTAAELLPEIPSATTERPMRTSDFARFLVDPDDRQAVVQPGTIRIRVSPFVYSAWGFGVLMPKHSSAAPEEDARLA